MSTDSVLVTASAPTPDDLAIGAMQAVSLGRLERYDIDGAWPDDPLVTVAGHRPDDDVPLVVQVGRPRQVPRANAADLSADLFVRAPDDGSGRLWLTDLTMLTPEDPAVAEEHYLTVMALAAPIASAHDGYLVITSGDTPQVVPLDGVAEPEPLSLDDLPDRVEPVPPAEVFVGAVLREEGTGLQQWGATLDAVRTLCQRMPGAYPDHVLTEQEWRPLPDGEGPEWWPMQQSLYASSARFTWEVDGSQGTDGTAVCQVQGQGPTPDDASPALGQGLVELAAGPLDYAYAHAWHPDEPWTGAVGPRMTGNGPYFMLSERLLDQGLPNLYWLQVLGPRWVERIGRDRIAATPAHRVAEVAEGRWLVQLAPSLRAVLDDYPAFAAAREAAVAHLGAEHFPHR